MPLHSCLHLPIHQLLHRMRADDMLSKLGLLQKLQISQCRARVRQVFQVRRLAPVL